MFKTFTLSYSGMTDVQTESVWIWERSGIQLSSDLNNVIWNQGEPNNYGQEHCAGFIKTVKLLNDFPCSNKLGIICQKE